MFALMLDIFFVAIAAITGLVAGWWLRGSNSEKVADEPEEVSEENAQHEEPVQDPDQVEEIISRLHQLTASVAADVGEHSHRVHEISEELTLTNPSDAGVLNIVERLVSANEQMEKQLNTAEDRLKEQAKEIETHVREARTDALTSLFNRRGFDDELSAAVDRARQNGRPLSVMMMDVDHFKKFNDTYGHQAGDEVLKAVARVLRTQLADKEVVCRYGGEEFAIIFPGSAADVAKLGAERARSAIGAETVVFDGLDLRVTASAGLAELRPNESADSLVKRADEALYASKENGRDCGHLENDGQFISITENRKPIKEDSTESPELPICADLEGIKGISDYQNFCEDLERRLGEYRRGGATVSVILLEVDRFAELHELHGEKGCRLVLRATAQFLKATVRDMDHIAHFDEARFALLLPTAMLQDACRVAERLRKAVDRCSLPCDDATVKFSVSLGVAEVVAGEDRESLLTRAEVAVAEASQQGGNMIIGESLIENPVATS